MKRPAPDRPALLIAVLAVGAVLALSASARTEGLIRPWLALPGIPLAAAVALIAAVRSARWTSGGRPGHAVGAAALGALAGSLGAAWFVLAPALAPLERTGLRSLLDGLLFAPGLVAAALVPYPGSFTVGLLAGQMIGLPLTSDVLPATTLLETLVAAAPVEMYLVGRRYRRNGVTFVGAGALLGAASLAAVRVLAPGTFPLSDYPVELIVGVMSGTAAGWVVLRAAQAFANRRWPAAGHASS